MEKQMFNSFILFEGLKKEADEVKAWQKKKHR